jgi:hypothetical protein
MGTQQTDPNGARLRDFREKRHYTIDNEFLDGDWGANIGPYAIAAYNVICRCANIQTGQAFPSYAYIAEKTGMSIRQAKRAVKQLLKIHIISIQKNPGRGKTNICYLLDKKEWKKCAEKSDSESPINAKKVTEGHSLKEKRVTVSPKRVPVSPKRVTHRHLPLHYISETKEVKLKKKKREILQVIPGSDLDQEDPDVQQKKQEHMQRQKMLARQFLKENRLDGHEVLH